MSGPAAEDSPIANTHNVVLLPYPKPGADKDDYRLAVKKAGLKTATYLAATAKDVAPHETQTFELPPVASNQGPKDLPRIAYIFPMHSHQHPTQQKETVFYGSNIQGFMPTIVHPNEILDGALMFSYSAFTWFAQNHPVIHELYRRHGVDLWFAGVVLTVAPVTIAEKERNTALAARLAKEVLNADGIIATKIGGGAVDTDLMMIYTRAEEMGMPSFLGDVAISNGRIEEIGRINGAADRVLDVGGLAVAPGIIDFHTHFDAQLWWDPLASSSTEHGVTTVVMGNCGLTLAPCKPEGRDALIGTFVRVEDMEAKAGLCAASCDFTLVVNAASSGPF